MDNDKMKIIHDKVIIDPYYYDYVFDPSRYESVLIISEKNKEIWPLSTYAFNVTQSTKKKLKNLVPRCFKWVRGNGV